MPKLSVLIKFVRSHLATPLWWRNLSQDRRRWIAGIVLIVTVCVIWVLASFLVQEVESEGLSPFLLTYIANSLFVVYLPLHWLRAKATSSLPRRIATDDVIEETSDAIPLHQGRSQSAQLESSSPDTETTLPESNASFVGNWRPLHDKNLFSIFRAAAVVAPLWFLAQYSFNVSLHLTSITSNTILSSTSSLFTYALSCTLALEKMSVRKVAFIILCMAGVSLVGLVDERSSPSQGGNTLIGDVLCILSACFYAAYTIAIRILLEDQEQHMMLFFGLVGLLNMVCLGLMLLGLWAGARLDPRQLTGRQFGLVVLKGLFDNALSDYLWARAVLLIGPTVATLGLSLQFPMAAGADVAVHSPAWLHNNTWPLMVLGAVFILTGFFGINVDNWGCSLHPGTSLS